MSFNKIILYGIFIGAISYCFTSRAFGLSFQNLADTSDNHLKNSLVTSFKRYPQEKVFVHTNQPVYSNGETIWYKVYTMAYGKSSALSKIIYIQLSDTSGNIITQNKLPLINGNAHGNIDIGQKIKSGWYELSAFTSWMMNFGPEAYYHQKLYIRNIEDPIATPAKTEIAKKIYHANFYPEGGDIIDGNLTKIAFRVCDDEGIAIRASGIVKDNTNKTIAEFNTGHDGMGEFTIDASSANNYTAMIQLPDGTRLLAPLTKVKEAGIHLEAAQNANIVEVKLAYAGQKEKLGNCFIAASQSSGSVLTFPLQLERGINTFDLQKTVFTSGILRLTVFDHDGLPQAERILFINKHDLQTSAFKTDTLSVTAKGLNSFSLSVKDKNGMPVMGNFSVAVTDATAFDGNGTSQNIFSGLLLSPELKGEINNPGYYFTNESDSLAKQLDLVMLTNGWRHFVLVNNSLTYPAEQSQYIAGRITDFREGAEIPKVKVLIMSPDSTKFIGYITPDNTGSFIIKDFNKSGSSNIFVQTADKKSHTKKLEVKLFTTLADSLKQAKALAFNVQPAVSLSGYYLAAAETEEKTRLRLNGILLNEVKINSVKIAPTDQLIKDHVSPKYHSDREFTLDLVNNPSLNIGLAEYMRGRFPGLQIFGDGPTASFIYRGGGTLTDKGTLIKSGMSAGSAGSASTPDPSASLKAEMGTDGNSARPYFYLDEAPVQWTTIMYTTLEEIAMIRFLPPPVYFAPYNGGNAGAIMIYTKMPSDEAKKLAGMTDFDHFISNGYSVTREFSSPDYSKPGVNGAPDNRTTLYWNPELNSDNSGDLKFRFYNSDKAKQFKIILQGMDADGRLVYLEKTVQ